MIKLTASLQSREHIISDTYDVLTSIKYIVVPEDCIILDVKNVEKTRKGEQRGAWGIKDANHAVKRVRMLAENDYGAIFRGGLDLDAHGAKEMQLKKYHSSYLIVMM